MLQIERDDAGTPTQNGSSSIKQALKRFWSTHGKDAVLSQPLQLIASENPLEYGEAAAEFELYGLN